MRRHSELEESLIGSRLTSRPARVEGPLGVLEHPGFGVPRAKDEGSWRTKGLAEEAFLKINPTSTIIRPSIIFGPGDSFFNVSRSRSWLCVHKPLSTDADVFKRFSSLAKYLPFLPVFGGGVVRFQ